MPRTDLTWRLGSISFAYKHWRGGFYPMALQPPDYLAFYARQFDTIELDTTFHAVPPPERAAKWAAAVPAGFRFIVKIPRAISHEPGLADKAEALLDFAGVLRPMGAKLAMTLLQLPPTFGVDQAGALHRLLDRIDGRLPLAIEVRDRGWFSGDALATLHARGVTIVAADHNDRAQPILGPSPRVYVRLIGEHERFPIKDREQIDVQDRLAWWVRTIEAKAAPGATVFVTATNDYAGFSPGTVRRLRALVGLPDTMPAPGTVDAGTLFG